jgi:hypothetical protein
MAATDGDDALPHRVWRLESVREKGYKDQVNVYGELHYGWPVKFVTPAFGGRPWCCRASSFRSGPYGLPSDVVVIPLRRSSSESTSNKNTPTEEEVLFVHSTSATDLFPFLEILKARAHPFEDDDRNGDRRMALHGFRCAYESVEAIDEEEDGHDGTTPHVRVDNPRELCTMTRTGEAIHVPARVRDLRPRPNKNTDEKNDAGGTVVEVEWSTGHTSVFDVEAFRWRDDPLRLSELADSDHRSKLAESSGACVSRAQSPCGRYTAIWDGTETLPYVDVYERDLETGRTSLLYRALHNSYKRQVIRTMVCFVASSSFTSDTRGINDEKGGKRVRLLINDDHASIGVYGVEPSERRVDESGWGVPILRRGVGDMNEGRNKKNRMYDGFITDYAIRKDWLVIYGFVWTPINFQEVHRLGAFAFADDDPFPPSMTTLESPQIPWSVYYGYGYDGGALPPNDNTDYFDGRDPDAMCRLCLGARRLYVPPWEFAEALLSEKQRRKNDGLRMTSRKWWSADPLKSIRRLLLMTSGAQGTSWQNGAHPEGEQEHWLLRVLGGESREGTQRLCGGCDAFSFDDGDLLNIGCFGAISGMPMHDRVRWLLADVSEVRQTLTHPAFESDDRRCCVVRNLLIYSIVKTYGYDCFGQEDVPSWCRSDRDDTASEGDGSRSRTLPHRDRDCHILKLLRTSGVHYVLTVKSPLWEREHLEIRMDMLPSNTSDLGIAADDSEVRVVVSWNHTNAHAATSSTSGDDVCSGSTSEDDG